MNPARSPAAKAATRTRRSNVMAGQRDCKLPDNYDDPETHGIVIPHNSPVYGDGKQEEKEKTEVRFAMLKEFAFKLKPAEFLTYGAMLYLYGWKKQCVVITNEDIRNLTGLSKRTIMRAQNNLVEKGFLKRYRTPHKKGALWWVSKNKGDIMRHIDPDVLFGDLTGQNGTTSDDLTGQNGATSL